MFKARGASGPRGIALVPALILAVSGALVLFVLLWNPVRPPQLSRHVTLYPEPKPLPGLHLQDQEGRPFSNAAFASGWSLLFFGYTHCPDICPTTLGEMQRVLRTWGGTPPKPPRMVFVTLDPGRDTPERLSAYLGHFGKGFLGLTGSRQEIDRLARAAGAFYRIHAPDGGAGGYLVDHSAGLVLVDPEARIVALFSPPIEPGRLVRDLREIIRYREEID